MVTNVYLCIKHYPSGRNIFKSCHPTNDTFEFFGYPLDTLWLFNLKFSICHTSLNIWVKIEKLPPPRPPEYHLRIFQHQCAKHYSLYSVTLVQTVITLLLNSWSSCLYSDSNQVISSNICITIFHRQRYRLAIHSVKNL